MAHDFVGGMRATHDKGESGTPAPPSLEQDLKADQTCFSSNRQKVEDVKLVKYWKKIFKKPHKDSPGGSAV